MLLSAGDRFLNACISTFFVHCAMQHCPFGCSLILQATLFTDVACETYSLEELKLVERLKGESLKFQCVACKQSACCVFVGLAWVSTEQWH